MRYTIREYEATDAVKAEFPDQTFASVFKVWDTQEDRPVPFSETSNLSAARRKCAKLNKRESPDGE